MMEREQTHGGAGEPTPETPQSITAQQELIDVAKATCLLTIAMVENRGTPYWFIERLWPDQSQGDPSGAPSELGSIEQREQIFAALKQEVSPLSRHLLRTYEILDTCWQSSQSTPLSARERIWILDRMQDLVMRVYRTTTAVGNEQNPLRIIGLLVELIQDLGEIVTRALFQRIDGATLRELTEAIQGVAALYQAIGYTSQEQRDVLTGELRQIVPVLSSIENCLRQDLYT